MERYVFYMPIEKFKIGMGVTGIMNHGFDEKFLIRQTMFDKVFNENFRKQNAQPMDDETKEAIIKRLNETKFSQTENIDQIIKVINNWLE